MSKLLPTGPMQKYSASLASVFFSILVACLSRQALADSSVLLVMGDSLSAAYGMATDQGWVSLLQRRLHERRFDYRVVNASISGETTGGGLGRLPRMLDEHRPEVVIIELGANDGLRAIPPDQIRRNLVRMVEMSQKQGAEVLLVGVPIPANYGAAFRRLYDDQFEAVSRRTGTRLLPSLLTGVADRPQLMQQDGLHPNARAQPSLLDRVWAELEPLLSDQQAAAARPAEGR
jgi:acyl-CoA thioesterase-1